MTGDSWATPYVEGAGTLQQCTPLECAIFVEINASRKEGSAIASLPSLAARAARAIRLICVRSQLARRERRFRRSAGSSAASPSNMAGEPVDAFLPGMLQLQPSSAGGVLPPMPAVDPPVPLPPVPPLPEPP